jgi:hypothetical protein
LGANYFVIPTVFYWWLFVLFATGSLLTELVFCPKIGKSLSIKEGDIKFYQQKFQNTIYANQKQPETINQKRPITDVS